jgi:uncharacterized protein
MKKNVLITGGAGFVGKHLTDLLIRKGYTVAVLSRSKKQNTADIFYYQWDVAGQFIDEEAVLHADYIVHLAGENIAGARWSKERKQAIIDSRIQSAQLIYGVLKKNNKKLEAFISASAVGIYGAVNGAAICTEEMQPAHDFLGLTCQKWESTVDYIENLHIRCVKIRTGLVLGKNDGFLNKLLPVFKMRLGSALGSGKQYMSWVHVSDLCNAYLKAIENPDMKGSYNVAVNDDTTNAFFSKTLAKLLGYKIWLPNIPAFLIKIAMGEMAQLLLTGRRVSSEKIEKTGFQFQFENLEEALKDSIADTV